MSNRAAYTRGKIDAQGHLKAYGFDRMDLLFKQIDVRYKDPYHIREYSMGIVSEMRRCLSKETNE